jgi:tRNA threonylcarbamoyladenosine biosynthesis protein TsaB
MILLLNTSKPVCNLTFIDGKDRIEYDWQADRELAKGLLKFINDKLLENNLSWSDIESIGVFEGPGSFTGLRIGLTVLNTIADAQHIPIVGSGGEDWQGDAVEKLRSGENAKIVMPFYGSEANITTPLK